VCEEWFDVIVEQAIFKRERRQIVSPCLAYGPSLRRAYGLCRVSKHRQESGAIPANTDAA
jgi:hypothetical protein